MTGLNNLLEAGELRFFKQHIVSNKGLRRGSLHAHQLAVGAEILRLAPAPIVKYRFAVLPKHMWTNQNRIRINDEKERSFTNFITVHFEQLLI